MSYVYKNIVIIERCNSNQDILFKSLNIDFFDNKPFLYKNENDKILLFYNKSYYSDTDYHIVNDENINNYLNKSNIIGYIKLILDNFNIKITHLEGNHNELSNIINVTKEYFCKTIKDIPDSKKNNIVDRAILYWDPSIFNNEIITLVRNANLMSNNIQYYHKFSYSDVYEKTLDFAAQSNFSAPSIINFSPQNTIPTTTIGAQSTTTTFPTQPTTTFGAPYITNAFPTQPTTTFGAPSTTTTFPTQPTTTFGAQSTTTFPTQPTTTFGAQSTTTFPTQPTKLNFGAPSTTFSTQNTFGSKPINTFGNTINTQPTNTFGIQSNAPFGSFKSTWNKS